MIDNVLGKAIVLYTFSKNGNNIIYDKKVEALKELLPKNLYELNDQSSLLIQSECDIEELEQKLKINYNGKLEKDECVILVSMNASCLKYMCIDSTPQEDELEEAFNNLLTEPDISKTKKYCDVLLNYIHENTEQIFDLIVNKNKNE